MPRLLKTALLLLGRIAVILGLLALGGWIYLAQPSWQQNPRSTAQVDPARLRQHVQMLSQTLYPRNADHIDNLNRAADYIKAEFIQAGAIVKEQTFTENGKTYRNIIGVFAPGKPRKYIIGAHYDSFGDTPGADDNASGVAGLIELAHLLGKQAPVREIELVAWTLEEPPYFNSEQMGSAVHAKALQQSGAQIVGAISLEMIGYFSDQLWSQSYPVSLMNLYYPTRGNFIAIVGRSDDRDLARQLKIAMQGRTPLPVYSLAAPNGTPGVDLSDHRNYWQLGVPAVMITDTAFARNHEYHAQDTADRLDYQRMSQVVVSLYEAIRVSMKTP